MRSFVLFTTPLIAACSTMPPSEPELPIRGATPGYICTEEGLDSFVGQSASAEVGASILRQSGARTLRWIQPGTAVTMDLRQDRVNVRLDGQNRIESVTCG